MKRDTEDLGRLLKEQLRQLYVEIICAKRIHRDLLRMIWPETLDMIVPGRCEPTLAVRIDPAN